MQVFRDIATEVKRASLSCEAALVLLAKLKAEREAPRDLLHPLVQVRCNDDVLPTRFLSVLTGREFELADHVVADAPILPGAAQLEMMLAAVAHAPGTEWQRCGGKVLVRNVTWAHPIVVADEPQAVHVELAWTGAGGCECSIYSFPRAEGHAGDGAGRTLHTQCLVVFSGGDRASDPRLDLRALEARCLKSVDVARTYETYAHLGIAYGSSFKSLQEIRTGLDEDGEPFALARVALPEHLLGTQGQYLLHPSILDGALQAVCGFAWSADRVRDASPMLMLPFAVEHMQVLGRMPAIAHVYVRRSTGEQSVSAFRFDVDVCDKRGQVCARIRGFRGRPLVERSVVRAESRAQSERRVEVASSSTQLWLTPSWDAVAPPFRERWPEPEARVLAIGLKADQLRRLRDCYPALTALELDEHASDDHIASAIAGAGDVQHVLYFAQPAPFATVTDEALITATASTTLVLLRTVKALLKLQCGSKSLGLTVVTQQSLASRARLAPDPASASVHGLLGSLAKEYEHWRIRVVDVAADGDLPLDDLLRLPSDPRGESWVSRRGRWYQQRVLPCRMAEAAEPPWRAGGTYVLIGGAGGLGEVLSEYLIREHGAHTVWIGRRECDSTIQAKIDRLAKVGRAPWYIAADATNHDALRAAHRSICERHARIDGLVHMPIDLLDSSLGNMDDQRFRACLAAKVDTSVRMAQVFSLDPPKLVVFFSSLQSFAKAPGQSNYAAGCAFVDAFAKELAHAWPSSVKVMNWGYWGSVGIVATETYQRRMAELGVASIEPADAMAALTKLLASQLDQLAYGKINGDSSTQAADAASLVELARAGRRIDPNALRLDMRAVADAEAEERGRYDELLQVLPKLLLVQLRRAGLLDDRSDSRRGSETPLLSPSYARWLTQSLDVLVRAGLLAEGDGPPVRPLLLQPHEVWAEWDALKSRSAAHPSMRAQLELLDRTLTSLPDILSGSKTATDVMFPESSLEHVAAIYKGSAVADSYNDLLAQAVRAYVLERALADAGVRLRILEVGAGTGATSAAVFDKLREHQDLIAEYRYTDISTAFLSHADDAYARVPYLRSQLLDVERPLEQQDVAVGSFDLVIAANVLHATRDVRDVLRNVKGALKRDGLLLLTELCSFNLPAHLTFGLLGGWWKYEDAPLRIAGSPALTLDGWRSAFADEGFRSIAFPTERISSFGLQLIVAQSDGIVRVAGNERRQPRTDTAREDAASRDAFTGGGAFAMRADPHKLVAGAANAELRESVRSAIRAILAPTLKIPDERVEDDRGFADYGVDSIVAVRLVNRIGKHFGIPLATTVVFDYPDIGRLAEHIVATYEAGLAEQRRPDVGGSAGANARDPLEFAPGGEGIEAATGAMAGGREPPEAATGAAAGARALPPPGGGPSDIYIKGVVERPGEVGDLRLAQAATAPLRRGEVRVAVRAFSLNFGDLLCVRGLYPTMPPYPFTPGMEASGVVVERGAGVTRVAVGDEVFALMAEEFGAHATMVVCTEDRVWPKPGGLSFEQACAVPAVALTALEVFRRARVRSGERVLVQTATGGVGLIAVQLAEHVGAEVYATAGSQAKLDYLASRGVKVLINYRERDFAEEVRRHTAGRGVDVVINTLPGDALQKGLDCLAPGGRYVEIAMTALKSARSIDLSSLSDNQEFHSVDLRKLVWGRPDALAARVEELSRYLRESIIRPTVAQVFPFERLADAYRCLENRGNVGKVVVTVPEHLRFAPARALAARPSTTTARKGAAEEPVAIIGMSGRFPGAQTVADLWEQLALGADLTREISRWDVAEDFSREFGGAGYCHRGGFMDDVDAFDPSFFDITVAEAACMDPQQRLFLEEAWRALEDAGYAGRPTAGRRCGVFVGCSTSDYARLLGASMPAQAFWGNASSVIPARIAYHLDLHGPAVAVDTACSSSLVAIHLACQGLWSGETNLAVAGGVFVHCTPEFYRIANRAGMLSTSGRCHAFDERADGFVPAEAVGALVLKRLSEAVADGDHIHGVIRGSGINQDGATNGITAPSARSQERLITDVHERFAIDPEHIQLVEAHGTGTKLGDPIEYAALAAAFRRRTQRRAFCALGSVKSNMGHTANAAGVVGVIKILLSLGRKQIPPSLHFEKGNSHIDFEGSAFFVNTALRDWQPGVHGRRSAAVSSFGFSGTNAHVVIEEAPPRARAHRPEPGYLVVLSAKTAQQLRAQAEQLARYCEAHAWPDCGNVSYSLLMGRKHFKHRLACVVQDSESLVRVLREWHVSGAAHGVHAGEVQRGSGANGSVHADEGDEWLFQSDRLRDAASYLSALTAAARAYVQGRELAFDRLFSDGGYCRVPLPTYPFASERYWPEQPRLVAAPPVIRLAASSAGVLTRVATWERAEPPCSVERFAPERDGQTVILLDWDAPTAAAIAARIAGPVRYATRSREQSGAQVAAAAFQLLLEHLNAPPRRTGRESVLVATPTSEDVHVYAPLVALFKSAELEDPRIRGKVVHIPPELTAPGIAEILEREAVDARNDEHHVRYEGSGIRFVKRVADAPSLDEQEHETPSFRAGGVYWITGGMGGIGRALARHLSLPPGATIVLCGRSQLTSTAERQLADLRAVRGKAVTIDYMSCDAADRQDVTRTLARIKEKYGRVDGIVHCAGVLRDSLVVNKQAQDVHDVFRAKAEAVEVIDDVTQGERLDFVALFSSVASVAGSVGQSDYAAANAFLDAFAEFRNRLWRRGERHGRTVSIDWYAWQDGGMRQSADRQRHLEETKGLAPLQGVEAVAAFERVLRSTHDQVVVVKTANDVTARVPRAAAGPDASASPPSNGSGVPEERQSVSRRIKDLLQQVTGIPVARLDETISFGEFGLDSIMIATLTRQLEAHHGQLPETLLYDFTTIRELSDHLSTYRAPAASHEGARSVETA
jgi:acyl transferase domain-containing protein/NADPH:quinone reductase-like Zn-dependent oxidoreductase/acyl carrier protein/SAM-dependent methyltransferase